MAIFILNFALSITAQNGWTPVSQEQAEYSFLIDECQKIKDYHHSFGNGYVDLDLLIADALFKYLREVGTTMSSKVLKDKIAAGEIPKSYLSQI